MTRQKQNAQLALISLFLSVLGLILLPFLFSSSPPIFVLPWQNQIIGFAFATICVLGIVAGVSPAHCTLSAKLRKSQRTESEPLDKTVIFEEGISKKAHHPTCDQYSGHTINIKNRILCAGCTGLVTGATIALMGTTLYFFLGLRFIFPEVVFWIGFLFVMIGLFQHPIYRLMPMLGGGPRVFVNVLFVVGSFLLLASLMQFMNNAVLGVYCLLLILYWIFTRITMSRRSHRKICSRCLKTRCTLSEA